MTIEFGNGSPEGVETEPQGTIWIQEDQPTSIWRKSFGSDDKGWTRGELGYFNIRDFGAKIDDSTDDQHAWQAAITAAETAISNNLTLNAIVYHPGGSSRIESTVALAADSHISIIGGPNAIIRAQNPSSGSFVGPMIKMQKGGGSFGSRYGVIRDLLIDGFSVAPIGLEAQAVNREFENINIRHCTKRGLYLSKTQNCSFISCQFRQNGSAEPLSCNCSLDLGAANNTFWGCQFNVPLHTQLDQGEYHLVIEQSTGEQTSPPQPTSNTFVGCQFERSSLSHKGTILQSAGRNNTFVSCTIHTDNFNQTQRRAVTVKQDAGYTSASLRLSQCRFSGKRDSENPQYDSVAISIDSADNIQGAIVENCFFENFGTGIEIVDEGYVEVVMPWQVGAINDLILPPAGKEDTKCVAQRTVRLDGMPSDTNGKPAQTASTASWHYDGTNHLLHFYGQGNPKWRSIDVVQQEIANTNATTTPLLVEVKTAGIRYHRVTVKANIGFRMDKPQNAQVGRTLTIDFYHDFTGTWTESVSWYDDPGGYRFVGFTFVPPDPGKHTLITFTYDGDYWREISRAENVPG